MIFGSDPRRMNEREDPLGLNHYTMVPNAWAIMQAGNLYVYTMNNPVFWTDPLGLFAWNERDDQLITINAQTVLAAGGTMSRSFSTRADGTQVLQSKTVSVWGVDVTFNRGDSGVTLAGSLSDTTVRADVFYRAFVNAAGGEMAFLGGHGAFDGLFNAYHMHIAMFAASGTDAYNRLHGENSEFTRWGLRFGFVSGTMGGFFRNHGSVNEANYMERADRRFFNHLSSGVGTTSALFTGYRHFMDNHSSTFVWNGRWTNSTSFTIGLVNAAGFNHGLSSAQVERAWGFNNAFAARYFGR